MTELLQGARGAVHGLGVNVGWAEAWRSDGVNRSPVQRVDGRLAAGSGWPVRTLTGRLVWAPAVVLGATQWGVCCVSLVISRGA